MDNFAACFYCDQVFRKEMMHIGYEDCPVCMEKVHICKECAEALDLELCVGAQGVQVADQDSYNRWLIESDMEHSEDW